MSELVDFLLARFAEDEAGASDFHRMDCDLVRQGMVDPTFGWRCTCGSPARVLAECDAKRRIVEFLVNEVKDARRRPGWTIPAADLTNDVDRAYRTGVENQKAQQLPDALDRTDRLLRLLALSYADHPDYREEWRP